MSNKLILVLDDEPDILEMIATALKKNGFTPATFEYINDFWKYLQHHTPALIVLDLMLNDGDGLDIAKQLKSKDQFANIPIIMLTVLNDIADKIVGLEIGADDYMTKPFSPRELIARIKAILRRTDPPISQKDNIIIVDEIQINIKKFEVTIRNQKIDLTPTEFRILQALAQRKGWVLTRDQLLDFLWGNDKIVIDRTIDVHIKNLRDKLGDKASLIKNVRGVGYKLDL